MSINSIAEADLGSSSLRRSARLMKLTDVDVNVVGSGTRNVRMSAQKAKKLKNIKTKKLISKKTAPPQIAPRKILARGRGPVEVVDLTRLTPELSSTLDQCAALALQDYFLQIQCRQFSLHKIVKASRLKVSGYRYSLTIEAESALHGRQTLEANVWNGIGKRRVNSVRAITPRIGEWYTGTFCIPLISLMDPTKYEPIPL